MGPVQVVGATVIDGSGRAPNSLDITLENGRITRLGGSGAHAERLDAEGLTMTPGLIDVHVHLGLSSPIQPNFSFQISAAEIAADIFATAGATLDAGFTTVRDTGGIDGGVVTAIAKGKVRGPRVLSCGPVQCQIGGHGYYGAEWEPFGEPTAVLMADREVALVPTFAVVEQLLHGTAGADLAESAATGPRAYASRWRMRSLSPSTQEYGSGWVPVSSVRPGIGAAKNSAYAQPSRRRWKRSWRRHGPTPRSLPCPARWVSSLPAPGQTSFSGAVIRSKTRNCSPTPPTPSPSSRPAKS